MVCLSPHPTTAPSIKLYDGSSLDWCTLPAENGRVSARFAREIEAHRIDPEAAAEPLEPVISFQLN
jgi:hypothetical protein